MPIALSLLLVLFFLLMNAFFVAAEFSLVRVRKSQVEILVDEGRKGAKYTKARRPVSLAYYEIFETKEEAMRREVAIKKLSRKDKLKLVAGSPL